MTLTIDLPADLEQELRRRAACRAQTLADYALALLKRAAHEEESLPDDDALESFCRSLPRRSPAHLTALAAKHCVKPATRAEDLRGNVWPEDESVDEFVETVRKWRKGQA